MTATIIAIDVNEERLALAKEKGLCDVTLNAKTDDVMAEVLRRAVRGLPRTLSEPVALDDGDLRAEDRRGVRSQGGGHQATSDRRLSR